MADNPKQEEVEELDPILGQGSCCVDLHCHSEYSSLDGGSKVTDMVAKLKSLGRQAMALTDHGVMQGLPPFYDALKKAGMKPILGMEAYLTEDRFDKSRGTPTWHLTLLAESTEGYHNLCKLSSWAFIDGVIMTFGRPRARADWELLARYSEGIIAFTGCMASPVMGSIFKGDLTKAREYTQRLIDIYGRENVFGEIQNVGITVGIPADSEIAQLLGKEPLSAEDAALYDEVEAGEVPLSQTEANRILIKHVCEPLGLESVATGDTHYLNEQDANPHDVMICIGTAQLKKGPRRFSLLPKKYHMRTDDEWQDALGEFPEAIANTKKIAQRCNAEIQYGRELLPRFPIPDGFADSGEYLRHLCFEGLQERYPEGHELRDAAIERLEMELGVIISMGFADYFLIVWDLFNEANRRSIPSGPGRGSAAGAIVAYTLDITKLCPLKYDLLFERFLNPDRVSMPDIDMDFAESYNGGRGALMQYAREKYNLLSGQETAVAQIITFQKYRAKNAIKDAARVLADPSEDGRKEALRQGDRLAALIPNDPKATMKSVWDGKLARDGEQLRKAYKQGGFAQEVIDQAAWLEGMVKTYGLHACGVIITAHDLTADIPLQRFGEAQPLHTQYDAPTCEHVGLLKMDFLGLKNLDIIWDTCAKLKTKGIDLRPWRDIPIDDAKTFELFARGDTVGTFQFESSGMRASLQEVRPTEFTDLIALVALYRPGAMTHIPTYAARKNGRQVVSYLDPRLEELQGETYGITIYQEQSMLISRALAGFTPSRADDLRKAIGKKLHDKMAALKPEYLKGCHQNGVAREVAEALWSDNEKAADYSFNKSHAACYAFISYITGYLKANYPHEYMAALLSAAMGKKQDEKLRPYLTEAKRMGLSVLPPDINRSLTDFAVVGREDEPGEYDILFGLTAIRGVGEGVVAEVREERTQNGPFTSVFDLIRRMPQLNKTVIHNLIKAGAMDCTGATRMSMHDAVEDAQKRIKKERVAEEKAFCVAVRTRVESRVEAVDGIGEQQSLLGGMDDAFAAALGGKRGAGSKKNKLTADERRGVDGASQHVWSSALHVDERAVSEAILAALRKDALRLARKDARESVAASSTEQVAGIKAEEQSDVSAKEQIEERAGATMRERDSELRAEAKRIKDLTMPHLEAEVQRHREAAEMESVLAASTDPELPAEEWPRIDKLNLERHMLGIYVTGHPLDEDAEQWRAYVNEGTERGRELGQITDADIGKSVHVVGAVVGKEGIRMRSGDIMYKVTLEDLSGAREVTVFPRTLEGGLDVLLHIGNCVFMEVGVQEDTFQASKNDDAAAEAEATGEDGDEDQGEKPIKLTAAQLRRWDASKVTPEFVAKAKQRRACKEASEREALEQNSAQEPGALETPSTPAQPPKPLRVMIRAEQFNPEWVARLEAICSEHPGEHPVKLVLGEKTYRTKFSVKPSRTLAGAIKGLLHAEAAAGGVS